MIDEEPPRGAPRPASISGAIGPLAGAPAAPPAAPPASPRPPSPASVTQPAPAAPSPAPAAPLPPPLPPFASGGPASPSSPPRPAHRHGGRPPSCAAQDRWRRRSTAGRGVGRASGGREPSAASAQGRHAAAPDRRARGSPGRGTDRRRSRTRRGHRDPMPEPRRPWSRATPRPRPSSAPPSTTCAKSATGLASRVLDLEKMVSCGARGSRRQGARRDPRSRPDRDWPRWREPSHASFLLPEGPHRLRAAALLGQAQDPLLASATAMRHVTESAAHDAEAAHSTTPPTTWTWARPSTGRTSPLAGGAGRARPHAPRPAGPVRPLLQRGRRAARRRRCSATSVRWRAC